MKLLTFLGTGKYEETQYVWGDQSCTARYAPVASCAFLEPSQALVFATEEAEAAHGVDLRAALNLPVRFIPISQGKTPEQLWEIFGRIAESVSPQDEVAFDITHGLRSFPLLGLLAAAFLQSARRVSLRAVLYGAYDVRDQSVTPHRTSMFDLTPMLELLEWAVAAERFNRTGDSRYLSALVKRQRKDLARQAGGDAALLGDVGALNNFAGALENVSNALRLIRPHRAMQSIAGLPQRAARAAPALERYASALPFRLLIDDMLNAYSPLAQDEPRTTAALVQSLSVERRMIQWYSEREQWVQGIALAREWLLSWVMVHLGLRDITKLSARQQVEKVLGAEANDMIAKKESAQPYVSVFLAHIPNLEAVLSLWSDVTRVRNDILHAGMREKPGEPEDLIEQIKRSIGDLEQLPLPDSAQVS